MLCTNCLNSPILLVKHCLEIYLVSIDWYKVYLRSCVCGILGGLNSNSIILSRLLFCTGHIAQCQVVHCELNIVKERKKMSHGTTAQVRISIFHV